MSPSSYSLYLIEGLIIKDYSKVGYVFLSSFIITVSDQHVVKFSSFFYKNKNFRKQKNCKIGSSKDKIETSCVHLKKKAIVFNLLT